MFFAETLGNGKQHENTRLSILKFLKNKKKVNSCFADLIIFLNFSKKEEWIDVYFPNLYNLPKFQQKIFIIVEKTPEKLI